MKRMCAALLAVLGCAAPPSDAVDSGGASPDTDVRPRAPSSAPSTVGPSSAARPLEIYIDSVSPENPLRVAGRARTFENVVQIRVRDARGDVVAEKHTTSLGEMGHHNPYSAELWVVHDPGSRLTVEAFEYSARDGSERSLTRRAIPYDVARMQVTLMLPVGGSCIGTRAFTRVVPRSAALARLLVEALVAGADGAERAAGAASPFPPGSAVNGVMLRDGTLTVDFDERLRNVGGSCAAASIRHSVTRTLQRLPTVKQVVITAGGSERLALQP